jgi:tRNA 2-selenouridine synthase
MPLLSSKTISAPEVLSLLSKAATSVRAVDVRAPVEFAAAAVPGFINLPILTDEERHEVGLAYHQKGAEAAVARGHELVAPHRPRRVAEWMGHLESGEHRIVTCWRGGLRSKIAQEWIAAAGLEVVRVFGGYKAIRSEVMRLLENTRVPYILSGATGSGKTELLNRLKTPTIDLEGLARHRGSAFGSHLDKAQPAQASFENDLALHCLALEDQPFWLEDESRGIGRILLPDTFHAKMKQGAVVRLLSPLEERTQRIYVDYVVSPLSSGIASEKLHARYTGGLLTLRNKLGGALSQQLLEKLDRAFKEPAPEKHHDWIRDLLVHYYDKTYEYSFNRNRRHVLFQGEREACRQWIEENWPHYG